MFSVLPAPDSPLKQFSHAEGKVTDVLAFASHVISIDWFSRSCSMFAYALSAMEKRWGGISARRLPRYFVTTLSV